MIGPTWTRRFLVVAIVSLFVGNSSESRAEGPYRQPGSGSVVYRTTVARPQPCPPAALGTFAPTPYIFARGNETADGGFSWGDGFGRSSLAMYGPLSVQRYTSAPVLTYTRGYNGQTVVTPGTSFSAPNYARLSPVVYPTQASNYYGFRTSGTPPWWPSATNWLDQN
jgi:hypothetical protein